MSKHIKSTDPRKPKIVAALKAASRGTKVTLVKEIGTNRFEGHCQKPHFEQTPHGFLIRTGKYESLGVFSVTVEGL